MFNIYFFQGLRKGFLAEWERAKWMRCLNFHSFLLSAPFFTTTRLAFSTHSFSSFRIRKARKAVSGGSRKVGRWRGLWQQIGSSQDRLASIGDDELARMVDMVRFLCWDNMREHSVWVNTRVNDWTWYRQGNGLLLILFAGLLPVLWSEN